MNWGSWAGEIINLIDFYEQRVRDIMSKKLKLFVVQKVFDIPASSRVKVINT
jgi:hypothetical protein